MPDWNTTPQPSFPHLTPSKAGTGPPPKFWFPLPHAPQSGCVERGRVWSGRTLVGIVRKSLSAKCLQLFCMVHFLSKNSKRFFFPSAKTFAIPTTTYSEGFHSGFSISALLISLYISKTRAITIPILGSLVLDKLASPCLPTLLRLFLFSSCDLFRRAFFFCAPPNLRDNSFFMGFWYRGFTVIVQSSLNALHLPPSTIILKWDVK